MAVTADQVQVVLRADTAAYTQQIKSADAAFNQFAKNAQRNSAAISASADRATSSFSGIGAQFQDIGVTAAMGMNPLLIALQQGTQLSSQLQMSAQRGQSVFQALGAAAASVINPLSLATIATVALGAAAIQYFMAISQEGNTSTEDIKRQKDALLELADSWGHVLPAVREIVNEIKRLEEGETILDGFAGAVTQVTTDVLAMSDAMGGQFRTMMRDLSQALGENHPLVQQLGAAFTDLQAKIADGTATIQDIDRVTAAYAAATTQVNTPAVQAFGAAFGTLAGAVAAVIPVLQQLRAEQDALNSGMAGAMASTGWIIEQQRLNQLTAEELALHNEINRVRQQHLRDTGREIDEIEAERLATENLAAAERRRADARAALAGGAGGSSTVSEYERERQAVLDLIEALEYEQSLIGLTNTEKAVQNALRQAGAAATDEERRQIEGLVTANLALAEAERLAAENAQLMQRMASGALTSFINDVMNGKSAADALANAINKIAQELLNIAVQNLVKMAFGGLGGGGFGGGIFGFLFGGARARGGPVSSGKSYLVGENGPELFTPSTGGNITPNNKLGGGAGGEVSVYVEPSQYFDVRVEQISGQVSARSTSAGIAQYDRNLATRQADRNARYA